MSIQWYPGHIAKAEKALKEQLKRVDVVLEVRDARIPLATEHPLVQQWIAGKERVLVMNRLDTIPSHIQQQWVDWFESQGETIYFTNAKLGKGISAVTEAAKKAGESMNQRRRDRGMLPRPVRAVVMGFPNVGKSALINRLLGRRVVESAARAGITRQLRWVRISEAIDLLDSPGIIPAKLDNQEAAMKLAICDDIGEASYDNQRAAIEMIELLQSLDGKVNTLAGLRSRYELDPASISAESYLETLAANRYQGDIERTARKLLTDFRQGQLGAIPLELPPSATSA